MKDKNVPRPPTLIIVAAREIGRATLAHFWPAHKHGPDAADAQRMVAWLDKLTNLSSSRPEQEIRQISHGLRCMFSYTAGTRETGPSEPQSSIVSKTRARHAALCKK
jgi:hypothetical protein